MKYEVKTVGEIGYLAATPDAPQLHTVQDALDVIGECMGQGISRLMLREEMVSEDFFRLRTGMAGEVLQKLVNYHIRAALVVKSMAALKGKFYDFALEANRSGVFRVFESTDEAERWLCGP